MNLIAMLLYGDGFVVAVTHGTKLPAQELLLFLCRVDADFDNVKHVISDLSSPPAVHMPQADTAKKADSNM